MRLPYNNFQATLPIKDSLQALIDGVEKTVLLAMSGSFEDGLERYEWHTPSEIDDAYQKFFDATVAEIANLIGEPTSCSRCECAWHVGEKLISLIIDQGDRDLPIYVYLDAK